MLLRDIHTGSMIFEVKQALVKMNIDESITDYFSVQLSKMKHKPAEELFTGTDKLDIEQLAQTITALKVLSNKDYRAALSREDIGIHPNSSKELFKFLDKVDKSGKHEKDIESIFRALKSLAPSTYRKELEALEKLKDADKSKRHEAIQKVEDLAKRVTDMFKKLNSLASGIQSSSAATQKLAV